MYFSVSFFLLICPDAGQQKGDISFFLSLFVSFNEIYTTGSLHFPSGIVERAKRERA